MELPSTLAGQEDYIYENVPDVQTGRMAHIGVLRSTSSYNIFTTEGSELNLAETMATPDSENEIERIVMFKRKQVAAERRTGKKLLRGLYKNNKIEEREEAFGRFKNGEDGKDKTDKELCRLHDALCGRCVDCKLYGFANAESDVDGSRRSRVLTDSAFSIRGLEDRREDITFNAQSEENESEASTALNSRAHTKPETFFPSIVTLVDFTYRELYWLVNLLRDTTRYGAETSRTGYIENELVSVWFDTRETLSNLELAQRTRAELENDNGDTEIMTQEKVLSAMEKVLPNSDVTLNLSEKKEKNSPDDDESQDNTLEKDVEKKLNSDKSQIKFLKKLHQAQVGDSSES